MVKDQNTGWVTKVHLSKKDYEINLTLKKLLISFSKITT